VTAVTGHDAEYAIQENIQLNYKNHSQGNILCFFLKNNILCLGKQNDRFRN